MNSIDYVVNKVLDAIRKDTKRKTTGYDTIGIVKRIDGNIAWVSFDNGLTETPVNKSINCKKGDNVRVRVSNGSAFLVGNDSAPPTDDTKAEHAQTTAEVAEKTAQDAQVTASEAQEEAEHTSNYFWHVDGSGAESGAYVTEVPQADFLANPSGGNLLMQTNAVRIRRALTTYALFSNEGMAISPTGNNYTTYGVDSVKYNYGGAKCEVSFGGETGTGKLLTKILTHIPLTQKDADSSIEVLSNSLDTSQSSITMRTGYNTYPRLEFTMQNAKFDMRGLQTAGATNKYFTVDLDNGISTDQPIQSTKKGTFGALGDNVFVLETHEAFASASISGGGHKYGTVDFTKTGYYPLAIAGWNAPDATFLPSRIRLSAQSTGSATVSYDVYNPKSSAASSKFNVDILWLKVTA